MGELGSGDGSSYPGALDTDSSREVNASQAGKTKARAEVVNDLASAIVAIENELGVNPAGTKTTVVKRTDQEHNADGTHQDSLICVLSGIQTHTGQKTFSAGINLSTAGLQGSASTTPVSNQITVTASGTLVIDENIEMLGRVASGDVPLIRLTKNLNGPVFDSTDTMISGTVPLARVGTTILDSSTAVGANTSAFITIQTPSNIHRFYFMSLRGSGSGTAYSGISVTETETVFASFHSAILRSSTTNQDRLNLVNGTGATITAIYKIYDLTET